MTHRVTRTKPLVNALILAFGSAMLASSAYAQSEQKLERVEVTGSSIKRIEAETALPVTVYKRTDIERTGATTVADLVEKISVNNGQGYGMSSALGDAARPGFAGASMRGLGSNNTLVLLNGRRLAVYAFDGGAVSLNDIPLSVVDRIEILRDGASSVYGTDAVAGVINLITRTDYRGAEVEIGMDRPQQKGGEQRSMRAAVGYGDVGKDNFNVILSAGRTEGDAIYAKDRKFAKTAFIPTEGINKLSSNAYPANISLPGVGLRSPTAPKYARPAGSPATPGTLPSGFIPGGSQYGCAPPTSYGMTDGETRCRFDYASVIELMPSLQRDNVFFRGTAKLPGDHKLTAEVAHSSGKYRFEISPTPASEATTLLGDPILLPASSKYYPTSWLQANYPALVGQPLNLYYRAVELGGRANQVNTEQTRGVLDLQGTIGGWDYDIGYMDSTNKARESYVGGYMSEKATIAAFATGNINPFGANTGAGLDLLRSTQILADTRVSKSGISVLNAKVSKELMDLPGGSLALALGTESRKETYSDVPLAVLNTGDIIGGGGTQLPVVGSRRVDAVFAELAVPIIKSVESQISLRHDRYNDFGSTTNPKVAIRWQPSKELLMRASVGTGFRAPTLSDVNMQLSQTNTGDAYNDPLYDRRYHCDDEVNGVFSGQYCNAQLTVKQGGAKAGGVNLKPEKSRNFSMGMVFEPSRDVSISVDAFRIYQKDLIGILSGDTILSDYIDHFNPATGTSSSQYASNVRTKFDPQAGTSGGTVIDYVLTTYNNFGEQLTQGADISLKWRLPKMEIGNMRLNWDGTYIDTQKNRGKGDTRSWGDIDNGVDKFLLFGAVLRWKHRTELIWDKGPWEASLAYNWQSSYLDDSGDRTVGNYETFDAQVKYTGIKRLTLKAGVSNLLDRNPPFSNQGLYFQVGYDPMNTNPRGRAWALGAKYDF